MPLEASGQRSDNPHSPTEFDRELPGRHRRDLKNDKPTTSNPIAQWTADTRMEKKGQRLDVNQLYRLADELDKIAQNKEKLPAVDVAAKSYTLMSKKLVPVSRNPTSRLPQVLTTKATQAMQQIINTKFSTIDNADLPSTADICKIYADLNNVRVVRRLELINGLLRAIVSSRSQSETEPVEDRLLDDLVECWKHFSGLRRVDSRLGSEPEFWLTSRPDMRGTEAPAKLFRALFPLYALNELHGLGPALVTTFVLLSESKHMLTAAREEAQPLLEALDPIVKRFDQEMLQQAFDGYPELWSYVQPRASWRVTRKAPEAWKESDATAAAAAAAAGSDRTRSSGHFSYALWHKRFGLAFRTNNFAAAQQAWRDLINPVNDKDRTRRLRRSPELFDYILFHVCSKSCVQKENFSRMTAEVLTYMKKLGVKPTVRTYTSMMSGWKQARLLDPIENLWASITAAGLKLDEQIWSVRIAALGHLGPERAGMTALKEMEKLWNTAVKNGTQSKAVEPGIVCVNAAISGLLKQDRMDVIRAVLDWATKKGMEPDIYTYNMLLSRMLKNGDSDEADRLLASMKQAGLTPDGATFTIILEAAFENLQEQTPQEQREAIDAVFAEMAACGIEPNQEAFAKMLHVLVKAGDVADHSVAAVLTHLRNSGLQPSTEMCTILVEYYVSRERPDLDSLRALVADRRSRTRALSDRVFWESVIKHYHRAGDLDSALDIVYDLDDWGIWPSLPLLEPLLRSLIHRQDWDAAQKLVSTVRKQARPQSAEKNDRFWKHAFWAAARDYDLLEGM
ncbi:pentatricopeptide repeat-containing protein At1g05670, mitochondrial [Colletotrichum spaethianum]|uniref:Pentatricopeptide repeat-containing protein At1g05670, mitochondrial n=1 Tax=Colletotrichum spaethianum TaxID=700344 RepID=A0AA37P991_9PEZI|nr:pentatricopeptide repeat-containing protein At1g05670, mitochondrial [Colletotrichum spaethianum]GKT47996.1 pentatricopeptide repeat-containing protein At1g05670, mitochondrial [Colletotrichum spaethianum]